MWLMYPDSNNHQTEKKLQITVYEYINVFCAKKNRNYCILI